MELTVQETENLSRVIGDIYDAALQPSNWPDVLQRAAHFVGARAAGLLIRDADTRSAQAIYTTGVDAKYVELYFGHYAPLDPTASALPFFDVGKIVSATEAIPRKELQSTRFYQEWAEPQGWVDSTYAILDRSANAFSMVSFLRHETAGLADREMRRRTRLITPHLRRAILVGNAIEIQNTEFGIFSDIFNSLEVATIFLNPQEQIVHANAQGQQLLAEGSPLRAVKGRLTAEDSAVQNMLNVSMGSGQPGGAETITIPLIAKNGDVYVGYIVPLLSGLRGKAGELVGASRVIFVHRARMQAPSEPGAIARFYNLTPSELRVLLAIVEVGGVPETADALGIGEATVRSHLQRIFAKTGTGRQADLVKMLASFSSPFIG